ncbi:Adhesion G protein-coupled receptor F5 [Merluccius polli]|uniref:Adhesion G protein-coupled receptor F5 n=1 Tax=Merluccius polli TaxID=89951 RepID=A0AA47NSR2_MERPO|nr:Adhesion G protein-coupled receptor F5 [Merluccius polli]
MHVAVICNSSPYGSGQVGDISRPGCESNLEGNRSAVCLASGTWKPLENTCVIPMILELQVESQNLDQEDIPTFVTDLNTLVQSDLKPNITNSSTTILTIVEILNNIGTVATAITENIMEDILQTVEVIVSDDATNSWAELNANEARNSSSLFLSSIEAISGELEGEFVISTESILLERSRFNDSFTANLNNSLVIDIPNTNFNNLFITTITFSTLIKVLPPRNGSFILNNTDPANNTSVQNRINAAVVLVKLDEEEQSQITNVTLTYDKLNTSLTQDPQCVFWNFTLLEDLGGWDNQGCSFLADVNGTVVCNCNHLTSFSLLMSTGLPRGFAEALDIITYIGVAISMLSLVICLIIEGIIWKSITRNTTTFLRHVAIVNTAVSLLIADIWFIIGASITSETDETEKVPLDACSAATFFIHLFYLALFFWMLVSALLLFYRTVMVFSHMSKSTMLAIGFSLGYGAPLIIAVVTVAATAPGRGYIRENNGCWLNWEDTYALLAFIIPAGVILVINFIIMIVVLVKLLKRDVESSNSEEKNTLLVIFRCVAILFPTFGLTWSLGVGLMVAPQNLGLHVTFALFNSLQVCGH